MTQGVIRCSPAAMLLTEGVALACNACITLLPNTFFTFLHVRMQQCTMSHQQSLATLTAGYSKQ